MNGPTSRAELIAALARDCAPVRRVQAWEGIALIVAATLAAAFGASAVFSFWSGILAGESSPQFWITNALLPLLGAASTTALVAGALPQVCPRPRAPVWACALLGALPLAAVSQLALTPHAHLHEGLADPDALHCLYSALAAGLVVGIAAVLFLRRGAGRAGAAGLADGSGLLGAWCARLRNDLSARRDGASGAVARAARAGRSGYRTGGGSAVGPVVIAVRRAGTALRARARSGSSAAASRHRRCPRTARRRQ